MNYEKHLNTYNNKHLKYLKKKIDTMSILNKSIFFLVITLFLILKFKYNTYISILTFSLLCLNLLLYILSINYKSEYKRVVKEEIGEMTETKEIEAFLENNNIKRVGNLIYILNDVCRLE